jgi:hypothetical protein
MALLPMEEGAVNAMLTRPSPLVHTTDVGALGTVEIYVGLIKHIFVFCGSDAPATVIVLLPG